MIGKKNVIAPRQRGPRFAGVGINAGYSGNLAQVKGEKMTSKNGKEIRSTNY